MNCARAAAGSAQSAKTRAASLMILLRIRLRIRAPRSDENIGVLINLRIVPSGEASAGKLSGDDHADVLNDQSDELILENAEARRMPRGTRGRAQRREDVVITLHGVSERLIAENLPNDFAGAFRPAAADEIVTVCVNDAIVSVRHLELHDGGLRSNGRQRDILGFIDGHELHGRINPRRQVGGLALSWRYAGIHSATRKWHGQRTAVFAHSGAPPTTPNNTI